MMNAFNQTDQKRLYNIATRKAASADTEEFSVSVNIRRENAKQISISECIKRTERFFEEKTAKQKMLIFETELGRKKNSEIRWKICYNMLCALPVWESFVPFLQKN